MKRVRPPQPGLAVRVAVAERQFNESRQPYERLEYFSILDRCARIGKNVSLAKRLKWLLSRIFEDGENVTPHELHHSPALIRRPYDPSIEDVAARYTPNANDPDALVYLPKDVHLEHTTGRRPGATHTVTTKGSDAWVAKKFRRLDRKPKRAAKIASRKQPWPKRKFRK
jgi:hypothetical protein